jgi:hypothetical protein
MNGGQKSEKIYIYFIYPIFIYQEFASNFKRKKPTRESGTELGKSNMLLGIKESKFEYSEAQ